ncbi:Hypothetical protein CINCED_3A024107 [Cinara cedri]|uniref:Uncharacterized protein n=1 Tax=Cinara cedri TaxID=506608 RepID=A0A5E4MRE4_9HEMI|nr:Hypothetical protein CINCED_3A024107 [Cinara cedri]
MDGAELTLQYLAPVSSSDNNKRARQQQQQQQRNGKDTTTETTVAVGATPLDHNPYSVRRYGSVVYACENIDFVFTIKSVCCTRKIKIKTDEQPQNAVASVEFSSVTIVAANWFSADAQTCGEVGG